MKKISIILITSLILITGIYFGYKYYKSKIVKEEQEKQKQEETIKKELTAEEKIKLLSVPDKTDFSDKEKKLLENLSVPSDATPIKGEMTNEERQKLLESLNVKN